MHVLKMNTSGTLVQIIDILRAEKIAAGKPGFEVGKSEVRGIGLSFLPCSAACGVEGPDACRIALPGFGRAYVFNAKAGPQTVFSAESRQAAFCADPRAGKNKEAVASGDGDYRHGITGFQPSTLSLQPRDIADLKIQTWDTVGS